MSAYTTKLTSPAAAINWIDLFASGEVLNGIDSGHFFVRSNVASRIAVGVVDPVASNTVGIATVANEAVEVILGAEAANQTLWVQTPADQSDVYYDIENAGSAPVILRLA